MTALRLTTALLAAAWLAACASGTAREAEGGAAAPLSEAEALDVATQAYIYGYPLVTMDMTRRVMTNVVEPEDDHAPMGRFHNSATYPNAQFRDVTAPNADTLYSTAWLDLSKEPYVLSLPDESGRYYLMPMLDGWTTVFQVPGKRTTGTKAQKYLITGPHWKGTVPKGLTEYKSPTAMVWILGRTYCTGTPADYKAVHALQAKYALVPLSAYGKRYTPPSGTVDPSIDEKTPVRDQVNRMDGAAYFERLAKLLKDNPPVAADAPVVATMARIGLVPGRDFDATKLDPDVRRGIDRAPRAAIDEIMGHERDSGKIENGWVVTTDTGIYGTSYLQRAFVTAIGLGANRPQDAVYPMTTVDSEGKKLSGANEYVMHFAKGELPPVKGFWSLTMYDAQYFFVDNPLNRYTLSPRDRLSKNKDGSIDLYLQHESPGGAKEANWLPAPAGDFALMLRLYWPVEPPKPSILDGTWKPPAVDPAR